jgi:hypothetical protein
MSGIEEVPEVGSFQPPPPASSPPPETPREPSFLNVEKNEQPLLNFETPKPLEEHEPESEETISLQPPPPKEEPKDHIPSEPDMHETINEDPVEENIMNMMDDDDEVEATKKDEKIDMEKHVKKRNPKPKGPTAQQKTWQKFSLVASIALLLASVALAIGGISLIVQPASSWGRNATTDPDYMPLYQGIPSIIIGCFVLLTAVLAILAAVTIKAQKARLISAIVVRFYFYFKTPIVCFLFSNFFIFHFWNWFRHVFFFFFLIFLKGHF